MVTDRADPYPLYARESFFNAQSSAAALFSARAGTKFLAATWLMSPVR